MVDLKALAKQLVSLSVQQVNELANILKTEHGIEPPSVTAASVPHAASTAGKEEAEEKSSFDVVLKSPGDAKLAVVKLVKELTDLGLKGANDLVKDLPQVVKKGVSKEEADDIRAKFEAAGAAVEVK